MLYNEVVCIEFLTQLFKDNKSYSALNTARSALSTFLVNHSGITIGNSPVVKRFMKGVFELRTPSPRYNSVWDVSIVFEFLKHYYPHADMPLSYISVKCLMLLALASMQRVQSLHSIDVTDIEFNDSGVFIPIRKLLKQSSVRNNKFMICLKYFDDPAICPVRILNHYINRTRKFRGESEQLFISYNKPHKPVSKSTLRRWICMVLEEAGIDTSVFKSHSSRAAAATAAKSNGIPIAEILATAGWSNSKSFKTYYDKVIIA